MMEPTNKQLAAAMLAYSDEKRRWKVVQYGNPLPPYNQEVCLVEERLVLSADDGTRPLPDGYAAYEMFRGPNARQEAQHYIARKCMRAALKAAMQGDLSNDQSSRD